MEPTPIAPRTWVDGVPGGGVSPFDRGLAYGDGLFETMRFGPGGIALLDLHLQRLESGCERLRLTVDLDGLRAEIGECLSEAAGERVEGVLKLIITRGSGGRGYRPRPGVAPTRILIVSDLPTLPAAWLQDGVAVRFCDTRLGTNLALAGIKHLNRLEQVLARLEWDDPEIAEGLLSDARGRIVEGVSSNVFFASGGRLVTPVIDTCGVEGVMRRYIVEHVARALGVPVTTASCERAMLAGAQELFLCNSVIGVWPIRQLATRTVPVGPITRRVQAHVAQLFAN